MGLWLYKDQTDFKSEIDSEELDLIEMELHAVADCLGATLVNQIVNGISADAKRHKRSLLESFESYLAAYPDSPEMFLAMLDTFQRKVVEYLRAEHPNPEAFVRAVLCLTVRADVLKRLTPQQQAHLLREVFRESLCLIYAQLANSGADCREVSQPKNIAEMVAQAKLIVLGCLGKLRVAQGIQNGPQISSASNWQAQAATLSRELRVVSRAYRRLQQTNAELRQRIQLLEGKPTAPLCSSAAQPPAVQLPRNIEPTRASYDLGNTGSAAAASGLSSSSSSSSSKPASAEDDLIDFLDVDEEEEDDTSDDFRF